MKLRNCPVCGHHDMHFFEEGPARKDENGEWWFVDVTEKFIECNVCGHSTSDWDEGGAELLWNTESPQEWELRWWSNELRKETDSSESDTMEGE